jgi:hypothetical protein
MTARSFIGRMIHTKTNGATKVGQESWAAVCSSMVICMLGVWRVHIRLTREERHSAFIHVESSIFILKDHVFALLAYHGIPLNPVFFRCLQYVARKSVSDTEPHGPTVANSPISVATPTHAILARLLAPGSVARQANWHTNVVYCQYLALAQAED